MVKTLAQLSNPTVRSLPPCNLNTCTKDHLRAYLHNTFDLYETLFSCLKDDQYFYLSPDRLRRPLIFYFVHTASLYVNKLMLAGLIDKRVNLALESMCEIGVDEMSWDDMDNEGFEWPTVPDALEYRNTVRKLVLDVIDRTLLELPITEKSPLWALFMGFEHDRIHLETSSVLLHQMPVECVEKPQGWQYGPSSTGIDAVNQFVRVSEGEVTFGKPLDFPSYGWDNEYGSETMKVPEFEATQFLTTNREFLRFVKSGGYSNKEYWTEEGWKWKLFREARHPTFWVCNKGCKAGGGQGLEGRTHCHLDESHHEADGENEKFMYRAMFDVIDMPLDWPVEVNYHEARAYCKWLGEGYRLLTEAEHHRLRDTYPDAGSDPLDIKRDIIFRDEKDWGNLNMVYGSSTPVNLFPPTKAGFYDVFGNVWEWGEDHFNGLPGFRTCRFYDDFSTPCFDGRHNMMFGGAWVSTGDEASSFARFAFRRHFFQHLGFRVVRPTTTATPARLVNSEIFILCAGCVQENTVTITDPAVVLPSTNSQFITETIPWLDKYLVMQYLPELLNISEESRNYPVSCARILLETAKGLRASTSTVLEIGCGVGRTAFEMARVANKVVAVDYTGRFIHVAQQLQDQGMYEFEALGQRCVAVVPRDIDRRKVDFRQLTCLPNNIGNYDLILFNDLWKFTNPKAWLLRMRELINPGGIVMITFGGFENKLTFDSQVLSPSGDPEETLQELTRLMSGQLSLIETTELSSSAQLCTIMSCPVEERTHISLWRRV